MRATYIHSSNVINVEFPDNIKGENFQIPCSARFWEAAHPQTGRWSFPQAKRAVAAAVANHFDLVGDNGEALSTRLVSDSRMFEYYVQEHRATMYNVRVRLMETDEFNKPVRAEKKFRAEWRSRIVVG